MHARGGGSWREEKDLLGSGERKTRAGAGRARGGFWAGPAGRDSGPLPREMRRERPRLSCPQAPAPAATRVVPPPPARQMARASLLPSGASGGGTTWPTMRGTLLRIQKSLSHALALRPARPDSQMQGTDSLTLEPTAVGDTPPFLRFLQRLVVVPSIYFKGTFNK